MLTIKKTLAAATLLCAFALCAGLPANANEPVRGLPQYGQGWTPEQWSEARRIFDESNAGMDTTRQELASKREMLNRELGNPNPDPGTIEKLSREIGELRGKMLSARATARARLAERGLPADCYGPCNSYYYGPNMMMDYNGWGGHHGGWGGGWHHGPRGGWGGWGCGMWR